MTELKFGKFALLGLSSQLCNIQTQSSGMSYDMSRYYSSSNSSSFDVHHPQRQVCLLGIGVCLVFHF